MAELDRNDAGLAAAMAATCVEAQRAGHALIERCRRGCPGGRVPPPRGLLANGPPDIQGRKLDGTGLAGCFDAVVISGDSRVGKPSPAAFDVALAALGVRPDEAVMVGDRERGVQGALAAGIRPVWVAADRPAPEPDRGDTIPSIRALGALLEAWAGTG